MLLWLIVFTLYRISTNNLIIFMGGVWMTSRAVNYILETMIRSVIHTDEKVAVCWIFCICCVVS